MKLEEPPNLQIDSYGADYELHCARRDTQWARVDIRFHLTFAILATLIPFYWIFAPFMWKEWANSKVEYRRHLEKWWKEYHEFERRLAEQAVAKLEGNQKATATQYGSPSQITNKNYWSINWP